MKLDLNEFAGGALREKVDNSFERVCANLMDKNTAYKDKREVNVKIVFQQNEERDDVKVDIQVKEKLAPQMPVRTNIATGIDLATGEVYAEEYGGGHIRGQISMDETKEDNIVDFRKQEAK